MSRNLLLITLLLASTFAAPTHAAEKDERGLLPSLRQDSKDENENDRRALQTEIMITRAELKAIDALQKIITKKRGTEQEPELLHRLTELYMRRARTGRFFDLHPDANSSKVSVFPIPPQKTLDWIRKAVVVYQDIEKRFPKYDELDSVYFNDAFAHQQLSQIPEAEKLYKKLLEKTPNSRLVPDTAVALGELNYDAGHFAEALKDFELVKKYPDNRVYTYGLYKMAWAHYNLKDSEGGIQGLLEVLKACPADADETTYANRQNLRKEALRDMTLFVSDARPAAELYAFFKGITTESELAQAMQDLSKLFLSHGRLKELNTFTLAFNDAHPENHTRVKLMLNMTEAEETQRHRDEVVKLLTDVGALCRPTSQWRGSQSPEVLNDSCKEAFPAKVHEIAAKWWDIWEKNKQHDEFSALTEKILKVVLDNEDPKNPDIATRFADAELLFQRNRFQEASEQYQMTAQKIVEHPDVKVPPSMLHDSDYGALFAQQKALDGKKDEVLERRRKELAENYLQRQPKGLHVPEVTLQLAVIAYDEKAYEASEKRLVSLLAGQGGRDLQRKAEDLDLEILNIEKKYTDLTKNVGIYAKREKTDERIAQLKKIELEASYAGMQDDLKKSKSVDATQRLRSFADSHSGTQLANDALFQSAAMDFVDGRGLAAGDAIEKLATQNPKDTRLTNALNDAAHAAAEAGELTKAAEYLKKLAERDPTHKLKNLEMASDFLKMDGKIAESRTIQRNLLIDAPASERPRLLSKLLDSYKNEPQSPEIPKLESVILQENIEPYATQVLTRRAKAMLDNGEAGKAFEAARKIVSRDVASGARAEARLLQAQILENELVRQSVKSSKEEKFALVLGMKTEKLEKAQTAYVSASRMTTDPKLLADAYSGIDRCAANYIDALETVKAPESLSESDQQALKKEIARMLEPIKKQRDDNRKEIRKLASVTSDGPHTMWADMPPDHSPVPSVPGDWKFLKPYLAKAWSDDGKDIDRVTTSKPTCDTKKPEFNGCFLKGNYEVARGLARDLTQNKATRVQGWHHLALIADAQGLKEKALWLLKLAQSESANNPLVAYEKGRMLVKLEGNAAATTDFALVLNSSMSSTEIQILKGFHAFSEGDLAQVKTVFGAFSTAELYDLNIGLLLSEAEAQLGDADQALRLVADLSKIKNGPDVLIQEGRLQEVYKFAPVPALEAYKQALKVAKDPAQKEWLERKTEYLKVNFKVGVNVISGD